MVSVRLMEDNRLLAICQQSSMIDFGPSRQYRRSQFGFIAAQALTVNRLQSIEVHAAVLIPHRSWLPGQVNVAVSRATSLYRTWIVGGSGTNPQEHAELIWSKVQVNPVATVVRKFFGFAEPQLIPMPQL